MTVMTDPDAVCTGVDRRHILLGLAATALLPGCGKEAVASSSRLRSSASKGGYELIFRTADLRPKGFEIAYNQFNSGHLVIEALNGGSLDFGSMSEIPPIFAAASSTQSFRQIATIQGDVNNQVILDPIQPVGCDIHKANASDLIDDDHARLWKRPGGANTNDRRKIERDPQYRSGAQYA